MAKLFRMAPGGTITALWMLVGGAAYVFGHLRGYWLGGWLIILALCLMLGPAVDTMWGRDG